MVCTSRTDHDKHVAAQANPSLSNGRASLSRSLATDISVDSRSVHLGMEGDTELIEIKNNSTVGPVTVTSTYTDCT